MISHPERTEVLVQVHLKTFYVHSITYHFYKDFIMQLQVKIEAKDIESEVNKLIKGRIKSIATTEVQNLLQKVIEEKVEKYLDDRMSWFLEEKIKDTMHKTLREYKTTSAPKLQEELDKVTETIAKKWLEIDYGVEFHRRVEEEVKKKIKSLLNG